MTPAEAAAAAAAKAAATPPVVTPPETDAAVVTPPAVVETPPPADAPWTKDITELFEDEAVRSQVDAYLREKQQPYITKLESDRAEAKAAAEEAAAEGWVLRALNEDPAAALLDISTQIYGAEMGQRVNDLITAGATPADAEAAAAAEADPEEIDLAKLPQGVREAVEFASAEKARQAQAEIDKQAQAEIDSATAEYDTWRAALLAAQPDVKENTLHRYVMSVNVPDNASAEELFAAALAAYREDFPAPTVETKDAPATVGGRAAPDGGGMKTPKTLAEAADMIWEAAAGR